MKFINLFIFNIKKENGNEILVGSTNLPFLRLVKIKNSFLAHLILIIITIVDKMIINDK